jgi:hypothetical protein
MADHASRGGESMPKKGGAKTSKRRKGARAKTRTRVEAPLNPEQILRRENIAASAAIPSKIADRLTTRRILISGTRETIALNRRRGQRQRPRVRNCHSEERCGRITGKDRLSNGHAKGKKG